MSLALNFYCLMKQLEEQYTKERMINGLYVRPLSKKKSKSSQKESRPKTAAEQPEEQSPRKLNDMIEEIRRSRDELRKLQEQPMQYREGLTKSEMKELTERYA